MKALLSRYYPRVCEILIAFAAIYFFFTKDLDKPYDKVIMAEGHGYYAYLPAVFIYHDLRFEFFNTVHPRYYPPDYSPPTRNFILEIDGKGLNKYFPGVSLLWLPFFLAAHLLALLLHLPADGYSPVYQYAIGLAGLFYTWLGLRFTRRMLLHFGIEPLVQWVALAGILFASNLLLYAASWSAQSHAYSFFLVAGFCSTALRLFSPGDRKGHLLGAAWIWLALIFTVRPQDILILGVLPLLGFRFRDTAGWFRKAAVSLPSLAGLLVAALVVARVCTYWYMQTGHWVLQPYHGEGYYFDSPHMADILFSFRKGWLLYSPFLVFSLAGIFFAPRAAGKITLLVFWLIVVYLASCWWCWTYSPSSFGQRPFIDYYCLLALQAAFFFQHLARLRLSYVAGAILLVLVPLNLLQTHQYRNGIIPGEFGSAETYFDNFWSVNPVAYYPVPPQTVRSRKEVSKNFEDEEGTPAARGNAWRGNGSTFVASSRPYSGNIVMAVPAFATGNRYSHIRVEARIRSHPVSADNENVVVDFKRKGETVSYTGFGLRDFVRNNTWQRMQFGREMPPEIQPGDSVLVYLWRSVEKHSDTTWLDNLVVEFLTTDNSFDFVKPGDVNKKR